MKILRMQLLPHMLLALGRGLSNSVGALIMAQDRHCRELEYGAHFSKEEIQVFKCIYSFIAKKDTTVTVGITTFLHPILQNEPYLVSSVT